MYCIYVFICTLSNHSLLILKTTREDNHRLLCIINATIIRYRHGRVRMVVPMQSVTITTNVVSSNPVHGEGLSWS